MNLPARIKAVRKDLKQEEFAIRLGVNKNTIGRWERGEQIPDAEELSRLLKIYPDINPAWLLIGEGKMKREWVTISKEMPKRLGQAKKLTFRIYPDFRSRLQKAVGFEEGRTLVSLSDKSGLAIDTIAGLLTGETMPTVDELIALAGALGVTELWLAQGDNQGKSESEEKESHGQTNQTTVSDLIKYVIGEVDDYFEINHLHLPSNKKAELIWLLYEELNDDRIKKEELTTYVNRLLKLVA